MKNTLILTSGLLLAFAGSASAQILYQESGTLPTFTSLSGTMPGTDNLNTAGMTGGGTPASWYVSQNSFQTNGSTIQGNDGNSGTEIAALLPFSPVAGQTYTLSVTLANNYSPSTGVWAAFGFTQYEASFGGQQNYNGYFDYTNPSPWANLTTADTVTAYSGGGGTPANNYSGYAGTATSGTGTQGGTYILTLNTYTGNTPWTYSLSGPGIDTGVLTFPDGNPTIDYVGIGSSGYGTSTYTDFTLTDIDAVPEPGSYALGLVAFGIFAYLVRRRKASVA